MAGVALVIGGKQQAAFARKIRVLFLFATLDRAAETYKRRACLFMGWGCLYRQSSRLYDGASDTLHFCARDRDDVLFLEYVRRGQLFGGRLHQCS